MRFLKYWKLYEFVVLIQMYVDRWGGYKINEKNGPKFKSE